MNNEEKLLWEKIRSFALDEDDCALKFSKRLARENVWSHEYALRAIEEYRKFIFLCCTSVKGVTPSDQVDQVWHLHLTYTKSYWNELCRDTLGRDIHHNPTKGGAKEGEKFDDFYKSTLHQYKLTFGHIAPSEFWPDSKERFDDIDFRRVNLRKYFLIPGLRTVRMSMLTVPLIILAAVLSVQGTFSTRDVIVGLTTCGLIGLIGWFVSRNSGGNGSGGGCSHSGCTTSCSSHHGGDSGCSSSGCSGCGSGGGD